MYVLDKEFYYSDYVIEALNFIYYLIKQGNKPALSIHIANKYIKKKYNYDFSKEFLWRVYRKRLGYIKNAKDKYKEYASRKRVENKPEIEKIILCECGCGLAVKPGNKFINGHNVKKRTIDENQKIAKIMRKKRKEKTNNKEIKKVIHLFKYEK